MAGTLELSQELCWMPAGWVYDNALEGIAEAIGEGDPELQQLLRGSLTDVNGGYLDLRESSSAKLRRVEAGLALLIEKTVSSGPSAMYDPSFYDGYVQQLRDLHGLLIKRLNELEASH